MIVAPINATFTLASLGAPTKAAEFLLSSTIAPEGSGRTAELIRAYELVDERTSYYLAEYTVRGPRFFRHNISAYCSRDGYLFTFNGQCPAEQWDMYGSKLTAAAESFRLLRGTRGEEFAQRI